MKKTKLLLIFLFAITLTFSGCVKNIAEAKVNIGKSEIFTQAELETAADIILKEMSSWEGITKVYTLDYCGDQYSNEDNLAYCNSLSSHPDRPFVKSALFKAAFHTANGTNAGAFNENDDYTDWQFYLAMTDSGEWEILTWGYC